MIYPVISIRDNKTGYLPVQVDQSVEAAKRNFEFAINKSDSLMYAYAQDYDLFKVGEFDTETGILVTVNPPELICSGYELKKGDA